MQRQLIIIDSKDRSTGTSSAFTYYMAAYGPTSVFRYRVNKVTIPFSWYTVPPQTFRINYNAVNYTVSIAGGQYNANQLATVVQNALNTALGAGQMTFTFQNDGTNTFTFATVNPANSFTLHFEVNNLLGQNYKSVGVAAGFVLPSNLISSGPVNTLTSPYAVNLAGPPNIYVKSSSLQFYYSSFFNQNTSTVVQSIPVNVNPGDYIIWQNSYPVGDFSQMI